MSVTFDLDGVSVTVDDESLTLLDALRGPLGVTSVKDGCSPQGQCGCCTVLVDGAARVSCVTPLRRVERRSVITPDGLEPTVRAAWADALLATGGSQCGFCTPGIVMRLEALRERDKLGSVDAVHRSLAAHLCRCTGWQTIAEAAALVATGVEIRPSATPRDLEAGSRRATLEGGVTQRVGPDVVLGAPGPLGAQFAADTAPSGSLVAVTDPGGDWLVDSDIGSARRRSSKVQGRRSTLAATPPIDVPAGNWDVTLQTSWVEPAYVETDAAWCGSGGTVSTPLANGGAFGGKSTSPLPALAAELADREGRAVLALWSREDVTRFGPKRPPMAAGIATDGTGQVVVARAEGIADAIRSVAPGLVVTEVDVVGPPVSVDLRAAGRAEAIALVAAAGAPSEVVSVVGEVVSVADMNGAAASARVDADGVHVSVSAGEVLDEVVLRSYCIGAVHMAVSLVTSEQLAVTADGTVADLTVRSFGVLKAGDTPPIHIHIESSEGPAVAVSDLVFCAVVAATWRAAGLGPSWPTGQLRFAARSIPALCCANGAMAPRVQREAI